MRRARQWLTLRSRSGSSGRRRTTSAWWWSALSGTASRLQVRMRPTPRSTRRGDPHQRPTQPAVQQQPASTHTPTPAKQHICPEPLHLLTQLVTSTMSYPTLLYNAGTYSHLRLHQQLPSTAEEPTEPLRVQVQGSGEVSGHLLSVRSAPSGSASDCGPPSPSDIPPGRWDQPVMPRVHAPIAGRSRLLSKGARQAARSSALLHRAQVSSAASGPSSLAGAPSSDALLAPAPSAPAVAVKG
jgi:hypothetical protein